MLRVAVAQYPRYHFRGGERRSETPRADREKLATWARAHALEANVGSLFDKEFFLDAPVAY